MAQTNNTTLQLYYSSTPATAPSAGNLAFGELAINIIDEKLYFKNSSGVVTLLASSSGATGTVSSVSVVTANGFAGTVATSSTTPAITLTTSVTGVLKGNGTAISAAVSGTDYAPATTGTSILKGNGSGGFSSAVSGTDYAPATTGSDILYGNGAGGFDLVTVASPLTFIGGTLGLGAVTIGSSMLKGDGAGGIANATAGTDYAAPTSGSSILYGNGAGGFSDVTIGSGVSFVGGTLSATGTGGTVTSVSVVSANGFAGSSSGGATPALTISTSITGLLKGDGTAVSAATAGTDYVVPGGSITGSAGSVSTTNWTISESGGKLYFAYGGVNKASLDSSGNFIVTGNVTAYGTP